MQKGAIGIFDSGYGGLTVWKSIIERLPQYDYIYLGDNARAPYGSRAFETVYHYTLQCVQQLFEMGCPLVILACNTASAKALRSIQQLDLPNIAPNNRVLGVIRPTTERVGQISKTRKVGVFATRGTVVSESYPIEINKFFPDIEVFQEACPMWVSLVENNEFNSPGADYFIEKNCKQLLQKCPDIDSIILGCTHYPLLLSKIKTYIPEHIQIISQGDIVADSLADYLTRHSEIENRLLKNNNRSYFTTDTPELFDIPATIFTGENIQSKHIQIG